MITLPQAQYLAYQLTRKLPANSIQKFSEVLLDAKVELNPHQIEAALFAFRSPLSGGAILADEVGLGKTIEAGLLISQKWAQGKRKILILSPSSLRKQWSNELSDKFYLQSKIIESSIFKKEQRKGNKNPFNQTNKIAIASYHFGKNKERYISTINWDLVIIDEAHRLRNSYKTNNVIGKTLLNALKGKSKILLTATPLQNSIMEIYGLVSFIAPYTFGDKRSFKRQFSYAGQVNYEDLRDRLKPIVYRTLRSQVKYLKFTERHSLTFQFTPTKEEQKLYDYVSGYLQRDELFALPVAQRHLLTLVMRKLLASSSFAIAKTLRTLVTRLERMLEEQEEMDSHFEEWGAEFETLEEYWDESDLEDAFETEPLSAYELENLKEEIDELKKFLLLATTITDNAKGKKLIKALTSGFEELKKTNAPQKALIFTESIRTQAYLFELLNAKPEYHGKVVLFNGQNKDARSKEIYEEWKIRNQGTDNVTGTAQVDKRQAIIDEFKNSAKIMIATEAAGEGINLQFCAMVVNYDLPWNPQRIEQRIGRCHRYGQKNDVVVVNFLNVNNEADQRVHQLLDEKFRLFRGVFGASDEILGAIESGADFESKIANIYQNCRSTEEIKKAFDDLEAELEDNEDIKSKFKNARTQLFENFDAEVINKLQVTQEETKRYLNNYEKWLWEITKFSLGTDADFNESKLSFNLKKSPFPEIKKGRYLFLDEEEGYTRYRMRHPLAQSIIENLKMSASVQGVLHFYPNRSAKKFSKIRPFIGQKGILKLRYFKVSSFETVDFLFLIAKTEEEEIIPQEVMDWLMVLPAEFSTKETSLQSDLTTELEHRKEEVLNEIKIRDKDNFIEETDMLTKWADDKELELEKQLADIKIKIRELQNEKAVADDTDEMLVIEENIQRHNRKKRKLRREIMDLSDEIYDERDQIIAELRTRMKREETEKTIFTLNFEIHS